jgi:hypothetical protein
MYSGVPQKASRKGSVIRKNIRKKMMVKHTVGLLCFRHIQFAETYELSE